MKRLLVIDDETDLLAELKPLLTRAGYETYTAIDGEEGLQKIQSLQPDLVVLDVMMPHIDGRTVLRQLRQSQNWIPVILLTKVGTATERAMSLQEGADDYINKPFDPFELVARIEAVLRRVHGGGLLTRSQQLRSDRLLINRQSRLAWVDGQPIALTARAFGVLEYLMQNAGIIVSRDQLLEKVWGWSYTVESRAVDMRVAELRKALRDDPAQPHYIETVIGQGYRFIGAVHAT